MYVERRIIEFGGNVVEIERVYYDGEFPQDYLPLPLREVVRPVSPWEELGLIFTGFEDLEEDEDDEEFTIVYIPVRLEKR